MAERVGPPLIHEALKALAAFRLLQGVVEPRARVIDILVRRNDVVVAGEHDGMPTIDKHVSVFDQPLEPCQFVVKLRAWLRVAVWEVQTSNEDAEYCSFDVAALFVGPIAWQTTAPFNRIGSLGKDGHTIPRTLPLPDRAISSVVDGPDRERRVDGLQPCGQTTSGDASCNQVRSAGRRERMPLMLNVAILRFGTLYVSDARVDCRCGLNRAFCARGQAAVVRHHGLQVWLRDQVQALSKPRDRLSAFCDIAVPATLVAIEQIVLN